jgi:hypothetical protein
VYRSQAPLFVIERGRGRVIGQGWFACTPLVAGRDVVGVLYNDTALSGRPLDEGAQALAGLFCQMVAGKTWRATWASATASSRGASAARWA